MSDTTEPKAKTSVSGESSETTASFGQSGANPTRKEFDTLAEKQKSDQNIIVAIMVGIVVFVVVTLWIELFSMHNNYEQDKSILLQNNQLNKDYFDKVLLLNNEIQDVKTQVELLKAQGSCQK